MTHRTAAILSIGDELILGQTLDTNSAWLSDQLFSRGVRVVEHVTVADDLPSHVGAIRRLAGNVDLLLSTGGLGPTDDDLTRRALADALGEELVEDPESLAQIERWFRNAGRTLKDQNRSQALRPASARALPNKNGTAPGVMATLQSGGRSCDIFCLPGPPNELKPMYERFVAPAIRQDAKRLVRARVLRTFGLGESDIASRLGELMRRDRNPLVGTTASDGVVSVRIRFEGEASETEALRAIESAESRVRDALGEAIFGAGDDTLASVVLDLLRARAQMATTVESCTGGMVGQSLTAISGSSDAYAGGWVTYTNEMKKREVGVPADALAQHGAVSEEVARAMAEGGLRAAREAVGPQVAHALAITGVAGPTGGSEAKPVGTVWIALASDGATTDARCFRFRGDRETVRRRSTQSALALLWQRLTGQKSRPLLWQRTGA
jgi:nicotinamide-nucleotide amidase